ncbi:DsrE family protein [Reinekea sp.]|jgi:sulfur relay (sulfurtransferase) DsrF/TusC family protein|uniref:DsrE family protein n=1 Tax=Reinekea sp. TaxID=1970455 RepID=UPI00398969AF
MSFNLILVTQPAYRSRASHETLEAIMSLALFDIEHKVVFFEQGLTWLTADQRSTKSKSIEKQLNALPMYDSEELYYVAEHQEAIIGKNKVNSLVEPINLETLSTWFKQAKHVEVF